MTRIIFFPEIPFPPHSLRDYKAKGTLSNNVFGQCQNNSIFSIINFSTLHFSKSLIFDMRYFIVKICGNLVKKKMIFWIIISLMRHYVCWRFVKENILLFKKGHGTISVCFCHLFSSTILNRLSPSTKK